MSLLRSEKRLLVAAFVAAPAVTFKHNVLAAAQVPSLVVAGVLIGLIMLASLRVAHHAASLSAVILTVPVIEALALFTDKPIQMGLTPVQTTMVFLTLVIAGINVHDGETNAIEGMTHFLLFATFLMLANMGL